MSIIKKNVIIHLPNGDKFDIVGAIVQDIYNNAIKRYNIPYVLIYNKCFNDPLKHFIPLIENAYYYILIPQNELSEIDQNDINLKLFNALITKKYSECIEHICNGANINMTNLYGNNLSKFIILKKKSILNNLIELCVNNYDNIDILEFALEYGLNVNILDHMNYSELFFVKDITVAKVLIKYGAFINIKNYIGNTPLHSAHISIIPLLIEHGANINEKNDNGFTVLILAILRNDYKLVKYLIDKGADVHITNNVNCNALFFVSSPNLSQCNKFIGNQLKIAELLLEKGVNINHISKYNKTPLYSAVKNECTHIVNLFIKYGANITDLPDEIYYNLKYNIFFNNDKKKEIIDLIN